MDDQGVHSPYEAKTTAVFFATVAFLGLLDAGNKRDVGPGISGQVIVVASNAAFNRRVKTGFAYITSKAGTIHLAKSLSTYLAPYGIRVNASSPGFFVTEMTEDEFFGHERLDWAGTVLKLDPEHFHAGRSGSGEDMLGSILCLACRAGAYLNGCVIVMDGGRLSVIPSSY
jgi:NAD(P)-dependent dehydrogenase (short-subunit alcohol dehydrogenase family)